MWQTSLDFAHGSCTVGEATIMPPLSNMKQLCHPLSNMEQFEGSQSVCHQQHGQIWRFKIN